MMKRPMQNANYIFEIWCIAIKRTARQRRHDLHTMHEVMTLAVHSSDLKTQTDNRSRYNISCAFDVICFRGVLSVTAEDDRLPMLYRLLAF